MFIRMYVLYSLIENNNVQYGTISQAISHLIQNFEFIYYLTITVELYLVFEGICFLSYTSTS